MRHARLGGFRAILEHRYYLDCALHLGRQVLHLLEVLLALLTEACLRLFGLLELVLQHVDHPDGRFELSHQRVHSRRVLAPLGNQECLGRSECGGSGTAAATLAAGPSLFDHRQARLSCLRARHLRAQLLGELLARLEGGAALVVVTSGAAGDALPDLAKLRRGALAQLERRAARGLRLLEALLVHRELRVEVLGESYGALSLALRLRERLEQLSGVLAAQPAVEADVASGLGFGAALLRGFLTIAVYLLTLAVGLDGH